MLLCGEDDRNVLMGLIICSKTVTLQLHVQIYLVIKEESKISLKFDWNCDDQQITSHVGWGCTVFWFEYYLKHL